MGHEEQKTHFEILREDCLTVGDNTRAYSFKVISCLRIVVGDAKSEFKVQRLLL